MSGVLRSRSWARHVECRGRGGSREAREGGGLTGCSPELYTAGIEIETALDGFELRLAEWTREHPERRYIQEANDLYAFDCTVCVNNEAESQINWRNWI